MGNQFRYFLLLTIKYLARIFYRFEKCRLLFFGLKLFLAHACEYHHDTIRTPQGDQKQNQVNEVTYQLKYRVHFALFSSSYFLKSRFRGIVYYD